MASTSTSRSGVRTRASEKIWLIGEPTTSITGLKLPTKHQVLSLFFHYHKVLQRTIRESASQVTKEVVVFWEKARIPTTPERNIIPKVEALFSLWKNIQKRAKIRSNVQVKKETNFLASLKSLFDIAHANAIDIMTIEEDKAFLIDQRGARCGYMSSVDRHLAAKEERSRKRLESAAKRKCKEAERASANVQILLEDTSSDEPLSEENSDAPVELPEPYQKKTRPVNIVTPDLVSALDRTKVSDRKATFLIAATAHSLGHDVSTVAVNRTSIRTARLAHRKQISSSVKLQFQFNLNAPIVIHWDGKLLPDISGKMDTKIDRLPIYISCDGMEKLLNVPKLLSGSGQMISDSVYNAIESWELKDRINAMCFDTTATNTGRHSGACHLLKEKMGKNMLYLPCRHHVMEIIVGNVFDVCLGPSSGPIIQLFKCFREKWCRIDSSKFQTGLEDCETADILNKWSDTVREVLIFSNSALTREKQPWDDYREFLELVIIFLGGTPARGIRLLAPGAFHRARWMARIIYSLKIWMFRSQFQLTNHEARSLRDLNVFVVMVYTKAWYTSPLAVSSPKNDLQLLKTLDSYSVINKVIADAALKKLLQHLWYLSEELIGLSFFADEMDVDHNTKRRMVEALTKKSQSVSSKRAMLLQKDIQDCSLDNFVTEKTLDFFTCLDISYSFTEKDPADWSNDDDFNRSKDFISKLKVVNDTAERGVALIQEYNQILTKDEEQKQFLLQVVEDHRKQFPKSTKASLVQGLD